MAAKQSPAKEEFADPRDEIAFLRQKFSSLSIRGHYKECFKLIEDKLKLLYFKERWPENFYSTLLIHKRCFPSMDISVSYDDYLRSLLAKNGIPTAFVGLLKGGAVNVAWSADYFKDLAIVSEGKGEYEEALGYVELMLKIDQLSSNGHLLRGWILQDMGRDADAVASFQRALDLNKSNYQASSGLAEIYAKSDPAKALELIDVAIEQNPGEAAFQASKARILAAMKDLEGAMAAYDEANSLDPLNADYPYQKAELLLSQGQNIAAIRQYGKVLSVNEGHIPSLIRLANLTAENQPDLALPYINTVVSAQPENRDALLLKASLHDRTGDSQTAIRQYKAVLELDPENAVAYGALGKLYLLDSPSRALPYYEKAVALQPAKAEYHIGKGRCHEKMGETQAAIESYKEAITRDKTSARAHASLGYLHAESDPKAAMGYFNRAIALEPENAYYYQAKGELLMTMPHDKKDAIACFGLAVQYDPGNAEIHLKLGRLLDETGNPASAAEHYRSAVSLDPSLEEGFHGLARILLESEPETALIYINSALSLNPNRSEYYYIKARIYMELGLRLEAVKNLRETITADSENADALQELSQLLDGDTPRVAMMYINRALEIAPENASFLCTRARLLLDLGDVKSALGQYQQAAVSDPSCHEAHFGMGKLLASRKDKGAMEHFDKAIALDPSNGRYLAEKALLLAEDPHKYQEALACFDEALARDTQMVDAVLAKARLLEDHGEIFEARDYYRRALLIQRDNLEATARMGILLAELNPRAALVYLDHAVALDPQTYTHHIWRGRVLHALGDEEGAEDAVREAIALGGETEEVYYTLAKILYQRLPETSLKYCNMAMELSPGKPEYPLLRGNIHRRLEETAAAKEWFAKALELDPACHEALARTAEILYKEGDPQSLEVIDRAIEINGGNASYYYIRAWILETVGEAAPQSVVDCLQEAVALAPGNLTYREKLVDSLGKSGARIRKFVEKRKLEKLRKKLQKAEEALRAETPE